MINVRKLVCLILSLSLALCCFSSCGDSAKSRRDFEKINIPEYSTGKLLTPDGEEQFNEYLDSYMNVMKENGHDVICFYISYDKENAVTDEELSELKALNYERHTAENVLAPGMQISIDIKLEDVDREAIMNLTANEKITEVVFKYRYDLLPE